MTDAYDQALGEFNALATDTSDDELRRLYEERLFPLARGQVRAGAGEPVDLLVVTAGEQHYSVTLSLEATPARSVVFLCTETSQPNAERAAGLVLANGVARRYERVEKADVLTVYRAVLEVYRDCAARVGEKPRVVVDITSGTKAMTAAASSAAVVIGAEQRYIESSRTSHRGYFANERVHGVPHPLTVMGDLQRREAERLFDRLALDHAKTLFDELHLRGAPGYRYHERAVLAEAYVEVDRLDFAKAASLLDERVLARFRNGVDTGDPLCRQADRLARQAEAFEQLAREPPPALLMRFLVAYARRRESQGLRDAAALVHYRTIELAVQQRLLAHGIDAASASDDAYAQLATARKISSEELLAAYNAEGGDEHVVEQLPRKVTLAQGWSLLCAIDDPLTDCVEPKKLRGQTQARNQSIFAHGRKPLDPRAYLRFAEVAATVRTRLAEIEEWNLPEPDLEMEFVRLSVDG